MSFLIHPRELPRALPHSSSICHLSVHWTLALLSFAQDLHPSSRSSWKPSGMHGLNMCRQQVVEHPDACVTLWGSFCALTCPGVVTVRVQYLQQRCMCEFVGQSLGSDVLWIEVRNARAGVCVLAGEPCCVASSAQGKRADVRIEVRNARASVCVLFGEPRCVASSAQGKTS
eukprot:1161911-Pelagomonas_calceolata.AAC.8